MTFFKVYYSVFNSSETRHEIGSATLSDDKKVTVKEIEKNVYWGIRDPEYLKVKQVVLNASKYA